MKQNLAKPLTYMHLLLVMQRGGAEAVRVDVYETSAGAAASVEQQMLVNGQIDAIAITSAAEVCAHDYGCELLSCQVVCVLMTMAASSCHFKSFTC